MHADVVVLGGDYSYRTTTPISSVFAELAGIRAPLGIYAVLGNQDVPRAHETRAAMRASGRFATREHPMLPSLLHFKWSRARDH